MCWQGKAHAEPIRIDDVVLKARQEVETPAREAGAIKAIQVREGDIVEQGDLLVQLHDELAQRAYQRALLERRVAEQQRENDIDLRFAIKSAEVARNEVERAQDANRKYHKSVSQTEMDRLRLVAQRAELEVEQARHQLELAAAHYEIAANEVEAAEEALNQRRIVAPLAGQVVEVFARPGEWVEPGQRVVRIINLEQLHIEAFLPAKTAMLKLKDAEATLLVDDASDASQPQRYPARLVFVSPEIDPFNNQVRIIAAVENARGKLRPGTKGTLMVSP